MVTAAARARALLDDRELGLRGAAPASCTLGGAVVVLGKRVEGSRQLWRRRGEERAPRGEVAAGALDEATPHQ